MEWKKKYPDLEPIRRLRNEGRELLGKLVYLTEKRDGSNISIWLDKNDDVRRISSRNMINASDNLVDTLKSTKEYKKAVLLVKEQKEKFDEDFVVFGELINKGISPARFEKHKQPKYILFDIWDNKAGKFVGYNKLYQLCYQYKLPVVRVVDVFIPNNLDELNAKIQQALKWCKKHRREGIVGKCYQSQVFFKEKLDIPKLPKIKKKNQTPQYPPLPEEKVLRALQHTYDELAKQYENIEQIWKDKKIVMPVFAKHVAVECREHLYSKPRKNLYKFYIETPIEKIKPKR